MRKSERLAEGVPLPDTTRGSTAVVQNRIGQVWTMRDGKAVRCQVFAQREEALEAVGLSEE